MNELLNEIGTFEKDRNTNISGKMHYQGFAGMVNRQSTPLIGDYSTKPIINATIERHIQPHQNAIGWRHFTNGQVSIHWSTFVNGDPYYNKSRDKNLHFNVLEN